MLQNMVSLWSNGITCRSWLGKWYFGCKRNQSCLILVKMCVEISGSFGSDRLNVKRMQHLLPLPLCVLYQLWVRNKNALVKTKHSNIQYLSIPLWSRANVKGYVVGNMRKCLDEKIRWVLQSNLFFYGPLRCYNIHGKQRTRNVTSSQLAW